VGSTGQRAGATLTLHKPADPETLVTAIAQVLGPPQTPGPSPEEP